MIRSLPRLLIALVALTLAGTASAASLAITHARIHTMATAGVLEDATLVVRNGFIEALGNSVTVPEDAQIIDAQGAVITPGLMDAYTHLGLMEVEQVEESVDAGTNNLRYGAALDVTDALNPRSTLIPVNRIEGITHAMAAPESGAEGPLFAGRGAVISLGTLDHFVTKPQAAMFVTLGEAGAAHIHGGKAALLLALREAFEEAKSLGSTSPVQRPAQLSALDAAALAPVLAGEMPLVATVHRAADIQALLRLAADYNLRLVIHGGEEAYLLASELASRQVPVILDPTLNLPEHFESLAATDRAAAILHRAGVRIAFSSAGSGNATHNSRNIRQLAGNAVAHGLPWAAALAAITSQPAALYGVDTTLGTLEPGKSASFVIWDGDPLQITSAAVRVFSAGRAVPMQSRQTLLRDRYAKPQPAAEPTTP